MEEPYVTKMFTLMTPLGPPDIAIPFRPGKIPVGLKFIIPEIIYPDDDAVSLLINIAKSWLQGIIDIKIDKKKEAAIIVTFGFYVDSFQKDDDYIKAVDNRSREYIEKYLGILSFAFGIKLSAKYPQTTKMFDEKHKLTLGPKRPTGSIKADTSMLYEFCKKQPPSDKVFSALFWLRRGLAERDPIETYSSLMVCLQILARDCDLVKVDPKLSKCPACGEVIPSYDVPISAFVRTLIVDKLGEPKKIFKKIWKLRNSIVAHGGNTPLDADTFMELTDAKFEAARLAFKGVSLALGYDLKDALSPHPYFFMTDSLMYLD